MRRRCKIQHFIFVSSNLAFGLQPVLTFCFFKNDHLHHRPDGLCYTYVCSQLEAPVGLIVVLKDISSNRTSER